MRTPRCDLPRLRGSFLWSVLSGTLTRKLGYARTYGRERKDPQSPSPAELRPPGAGRDGNVQPGPSRVRPLRPDAVCQPASAAYPRHPYGRRVASRRKHPRATHRGRRPGANPEAGLARARRSGVPSGWRGEPDAGRSRAPGDPRHARGDARQTGRDRATARHQPYDVVAPAASLWAPAQRTRKRARDARLAPPKLAWGYRAL